MEKHISAFPMHERDDALRGMSLRDYFAGQALVGLISRSTQNIGGFTIERCDEMACLSYQLAEAMLKVREANNGE